MGSTSSPLIPLVRESGALLALSAGTGKTAFFADRPNREVGTVETTVLIAALGAEADAPPNAALVGHTAERAKEIVFVELLRGEVEGDTGDVTCRVALLTDCSEVDLVSHMSRLVR